MFPHSFILAQTNPEVRETHLSLLNHNFIFGHLIDNYDVQMGPIICAYSIAILTNVLTIYGQTSDSSCRTLPHLFRPLQILFRNGAKMSYNSFPC